MTKQDFVKWFDKLKNAWENKNLDSALDLCADKFLWYETPFAEPLRTKAQLLKEWQSVLDHKDISVSYKILSIDNNVGFAHWNAKFKRIYSNENAELDGIYMVTLNEKGLCTEFHQWYNTKD